MPFSRPRLRGCLGRLLLVIAPLGTAFALAEIVLRIGASERVENPQGPAARQWLAVTPSAELGWIFPADTTGTFKSSGRHTPVETNSWGLRGPEVSTDPATRRVLMLGDSYTFGWGVADSAGFVRLLESELNRGTESDRVEFINGALPGYSIYQQIRMLEYVRARTDIHAVVATISLANDPIDEKRIRRFAPDRLAEFRYDLRDPASGTSRLIAASRVLTLIDERTTHLQFSLINTGNECRDLAEASLRDLAAECAGAGLPLVWVIVPRAQEIRGGSFWIRPLNDATDRLRRHYMELAEELGVAAVDLKPILEKEQSRRETYLTGDSHWNEVGHRAVAEAIFPEIIPYVHP
jgi:lysophospholipase L1-like esterase